MSILEKIKAIEDCILEISDNQKIFLEMLDNINGKLDRLLASKKEVKVHDKKIMREMIPKADHIVYDDPKEKENPDMDLTGVVLLKHTDKAFLAFKKSMQVWVAKSHLEGEYKVGNTYDLKVKEKSKWILDKLDWKPFTVVKG